MAEMQSSSARDESEDGAEGAPGANEAKCLQGRLHATVAAAEEELLACANCFSQIARPADILQEKIESRKDAVYPYELTVLDCDSWCYSATDSDRDRFDVIRIRPNASNIRLLASPSAAHSWFVGYAWRRAECECCHNHIGWGFCAAFQDSAGRPVVRSSTLWDMAPTFLALILTRLRPTSKEKALLQQAQFRDARIERAHAHSSVFWPRGESNSPREILRRRGPTWEEHQDMSDGAFRRARSPTPPLRLGRSREQDLQPWRSQEDFLHHFTWTLAVPPVPRVNLPDTHNTSATDEPPAGPASGSSSRTASPSTQNIFDAVQATQEQQRFLSSERGLLRWMRARLQRQASQDLSPRASAEQPAPSAVPPQRETPQPPQQPPDTANMWMSRRFQWHMSSHQQVLSDIRDLQQEQQERASEQQRVVQEIHRLQNLNAQFHQI
eukprot:TRINITY_DN85138_c0_g1_i1.p1 TRINITY_DN85138_c0_g1~~TRINITY_DN85138_c0_g1_i1.p1  ORF type:complete len:440 (-),score=60.41 TRINITY_DN85138_c0_g1_i1:25-1344(-)